MMYPIAWSEKSELGWKGTTQDGHVIYVIQSKTSKKWIWSVYPPEGENAIPLSCTNYTSDEAKYCASLAVNAHRLVEAVAILDRVRKVQRHAVLLNTRTDKMAAIPKEDGEWISGHHLDEALKDPP